MAVQINVAANQAALMASIQAGVQAYNQRFAQNNQINLSINARAFSQPLGRITGDVKDFEAALAASNARVIAFGASTAVLGTVIKGFKELATVTIEVEKSLADINRVFGLTTSQLQKFSTDLFNVSKQTASTFNDASKAALEFSRQGLKAEDVLMRTKDALTLTRLAGIGTANSVDALTSTVNGFAATGVTTTQILNKLVAVEQDYAVGAGDLAEALSRTGQAAQEAGVSLDQLNALVTAAQQSTARGGAVIGNALKTIFTRLQRTETLDQLEAFNISVRDVQGNILPAVTILQNFAGAYKGLADAQKAQLSEQVAGVYQVNILKAIVNDLNKSQGVYAGALQRGASATNEAEIATAKLNKTLDALLSQTATSTQQLANNIGKVTFEPLAKYGAEQLKSFVESLNEVLEGEGAGSTFANGLLKGIRNVIAGPGAIAAFFTLFKLIQNSFTYLSQALPQIAGITTETQNRKNIEQAILQIMQQQGPVSQALAGSMGNQAAQAQLLLQVARQQTAEYQNQTTLARQLAAQLAGQGVRVKGSGGLQVTRAAGYVPPATRMAEVVGAQAGGYTPGQVVPSPVGGVMNTAENVKYIPGFAQPFINPPANSDAGRAHRQNSINRTGVDPYMAGGFIPNFAETGSIPVGLMPYPKIKKALRDSKILKSGVESDDLVTVDSFQHLTAKNNVNFEKLPNETAAQYEDRIIKYWNYNDNSKLASKGSSAIDGYKGNKLMEVKSGGYDFEKTIDKFYRAPVENAHLKINQSWNKFTQGKPDNKHVSAILVSPKFDGFIPNFAPPTSAIRVPWFRKFGNAAFDAIQPTLGISRASDTDTFRSSQFRSKAFEKAATDGDPNLFAPLYEDFIFKALQLVSQPKIKDQLIRGYVNQPGTDQKQSAFDAFLGDVGLEFKGFPKDNLTGSISKNLNDKYERYAKANPTGAAKIKESIIAFNQIGDKNQLPSDFGKNFIQLAGTSYSEMVKNNPDLVKGLSAETNILLQRYVKNPAFLAMAASHGFIPNFARKDISTTFFKTQTGQDLFSSKGTALSGTVYRQAGQKSSGLQLKQQLNNMVMSILGNNVFFPDVAAVNPRITKDVNETAKDFAKSAALKLSSSGRTTSLGSGSGMMNQTFGNARYLPNRQAVYTGEVSGKMKRVNYDRLSDVLGVFWSANAETKSAWEFLKNLSESGKFEEKENIRAKTSLLKKAYEEFLIKNDYVGTRVKLSEYRKRAEGMQTNYGSLRSDLAGVSNVRNIGKYNGFIPNFAYKQAVMSLEENMSGNKAIFDTKPFPHIRNSSQPTFSSAIADHGGLANAMSDSMRGQKAAGLMNKGFVPNFAPSRGPRVGSLTLESVDPSIIASGSPVLPKSMRNDLIKSVNDLIKQYAAGTIDQTQLNDGIKALNSRYQLTQQSQQKLQSAVDKQTVGINNSINSSNKFKESLSKASTAISLAGPMIAGFAEQIAFGNRKRTEMSATERGVQSGLSTGLTAISTGAGIGAAFGPLGAGIGAAAGALVGLTSALNATKLSAEELAELNQEQAQKTQSNISAASSYIEAQKSLTEMIASGASSSDIQNATKKLSLGFNEIADVKLQEIFLATGGSISEMTKRLQEYTIQNTKKTTLENVLFTKANSKDLSSALNLSLEKNEKSSLIKDLREAAGIKDVRATITQMELMGGFEGEGPGSIEEARKKVQNKASSFTIAKNLLTSIGITEKTDTNFKDKLEKAISRIEDLSIEQLNQIANNLEESDLVSEAQKSINKFKETATKSFAEIFRKIERDLNKNLFEIAFSFEKDSSTRRIQASILDFSMNFQDSINSFLSNNLPDVRKFDFTAATAGQKAEMLLQKSQQDYDKAIADQQNERSNFLIKNTQDLSGSFKSTLSNSQVNAEFFKTKVLPQIQSGNYSGDINDIISGLQNAQLSKVKEARTSANIAIGGKEGVALGVGLGFDNPEQIKQTLDSLGQLLKNPGLEEDKKSKIIAYQQELINLQETSLKFSNQAEKDKLSDMMREKAESQILFDQKQANAKKELEINKQLNEATIAANKEIAIAKAKVDKENMMRMESMKNLVSKITNAEEINKARRSVNVNVLQRELEDKRATYGMGVQQISERKYDIEAKILKEQRAAEDAAINAEIQQRMLEMAAEQENTAATLQLNDTIMTLIETQLRGAIGGEENIADIQSRVSEMGNYAQTDVDLKYGAGTFSQYQALQRIQESRAASAANNTRYNTSDFEASMIAKKFNSSMNAQEQSLFLSEQQTKAEDAGNLVLAQTIARYKEQIAAKKEALSLTREDIDKKVKENIEEENRLNAFKGRLQKGFGTLNQEGDALVLNLGENLPKMFADGMVNGVKAAIKETHNLGDALMGIAASFLDSVSTTLMQAGTYKILGSAGFDTLLKQRGGAIRAQSGMYISGTGTGDKYPALLENGEYVLNRRAVAAMGGPSVLDSLNFAMAPRFAAGGSYNFDLSKGSYDYSLKQKRILEANAVNISNMEANMTSEGLENSPLYKDIAEAQKQNLEEQRQKKRQRKQQRAAMIGQVAAAVATIAIGAGVSNVAKNAEAVKAQNLSAKLTSGANLTQAESASIKSFVDKGLISPYSGSYTGGTPQTGFRSLFSGPSNSYGPIYNPYTQFGRRQTGGIIGSRLSDTIPGYMEGGLYNTPIVNRYNTGMQSGGSSAIAAGNNSNIVNNNTNANNSFNFNTTIERDGTIKMGANTTSYQQQDIELSKNLNQRVYAVVAEVIRKEKQFGGALAGVRS